MAQPSRRWDAVALTLVINAVLVGVAGVYTTTQSVAITVVACVAVIIVVTGILALQPKPDAGRPDHQGPPDENGS